MSEKQATRKKKPKMEKCWQCRRPKEVGKMCPRNCGPKGLADMLRF